MKKTYLVFRDNPDGTRYLDIAADSEWKEITNNNRKIRTEIKKLKQAAGKACTGKDNVSAVLDSMYQKLRYFAHDLIIDGAEKDLMFYELSRADYLQWNREMKIQQYKWAAAKKYKLLSLDMPMNGSTDEECTLADFIPESVPCLEEVEDAILIEQLRRALAAWEPWGVDLLEMYLNGSERGCNAIITEKYAVSTRTVERYKRRFEEFVKNFLNVCRF